MKFLPLSVVLNINGKVIVRVVAFNRDLIRSIIPGSLGHNCQLQLVGEHEDVHVMEDLSTIEEMCKDVNLFRKV